MENSLELGYRTGSLTVIGEAFVDIRADGQKVWKIPCLCDCGKISRPVLYKVKQGLVKSCGCLILKVNRDRMTTHGKTDTRTYNSWQSLLSRCYNHKNNKFHDYGGRGISVCDRWNPKAGGSFENFLEDMGECPDGMSIDRVDVDGNYCKENCRWLCPKLQAFNQRRRKTNTSGRTGVRWNEKARKWYVRIRKDGVERYLGSFETFEEACQARAAAEVEIYGFSKE